MDNERLLLLAVGMILLALLIVLIDRRRTKKTMDTIEQMLDAALEGSYAESHFDESRLSALETKFSDYLSSCTLSAQNVTVEKDKIKHLPPDQNAHRQPDAVQRAVVGGRAAPADALQCGSHPPAERKAAISH